MLAKFFLIHGLASITKLLFNVYNRNDSIDVTQIMGFQPKSALANFSNHRVPFFLQM